MSNGYPSADPELSAWATQLLGRRCFVVEAYHQAPLIPGDWHPHIAELMRLEIPPEPTLMIADGIHHFVCVSTPEEIPAAVAELKSGINDHASDTR